MQKNFMTPEDLAGVFAVPPLARNNDSARSLNFVENDRIVAHLRRGGITRLLYGGNAFLYHVTMTEFEELLEWLTSLHDDTWAIPSAGPSYGRLMDQARVLRRHNFPCVMHLPCGDPRDAAGLEQGLREFADAADTQLILYLKEERNFGANTLAGLDAVARLVDDGLVAWIKYAVVLSDPSQDSYLQALLERVDKNFVVSGIGERPAVAHMVHWGLPGFTTGSGCIAPALSNQLWEACDLGHLHEAEEIRACYLPHEELRDAWGPARVLHAAATAAGIATAGPIPPFVSALNESQVDRLTPIARELADKNRARAAAS